jgi:chromosome segregation ATPase
VSPLTKIFVMLLVVVSLLNAAATVVYVNKEQLMDSDYKSLASQNSALQLQLMTAKSDAATARSQLEARDQQATTEANARQTALDKANADLAALDADNKLMHRNIEALQANYSTLTDQLAISLASNQQDSKTIADLRDSNNKLIQSQAENDAGLARQRQLAETYGRQVEYLTEQEKKSEDLIKAYSSVITEHHLTVPLEQQPTSYNGPPVSGIVQDKQNINGMTYVTISVGSADNVQPGMEFRVVDANAQPQQFLGILTVTQADVNTAIGRINADSASLDKVSRGDEVTTDSH